MIRTLQNNLRMLYILVAAAVFVLAVAFAVRFDASEIKAKLSQQNLGDENSSIGGNVIANDNVCKVSEEDEYLFVGYNGFF